MAEETFVLTGKQVQRVGEAIRWVEDVGKQLQGQPQRSRPLGMAVPVQLGKMTEGTTVNGNGLCQPWILPSTANASTDPFIEGSTADIATAHDWFGTAASSGDDVFLYRHQQSGRLVFLRTTQEGQRITCLLKGALSAASTAATVDTVSAINGVSPTTAASIELEVANTHGWSGDDNALGRAEYHATNERWEMYQLTCPS